MKKFYWAVDKYFRRKFDPFPHLGYVYKHKFLFIHIPKTAGTSILDSLSIQFRHHSDFRVFKSANTKLFNSAYKFCFVRNPYDRLVSTYFYLKNGGAGATDTKLTRFILDNSKDFESFVNNIMNKDIINTHPLFKPQFSFICEYDFSLMVDYVAKFESINSEIKVIQEKLKREIKLKKINTQNKKDYNFYYTETTAKIVFELYSKDFELFDYSFESYKK